MKRPSKRKQVKTSHYDVHLVFREDDKTLVEYLKEEAARNERTVMQQVRLMLKQAIGSYPQEGH